MGKTIRSLQVARVAEQQNDQVVWTGGDTVVVQLGDVLDRGDTEIGERAFGPSAAVSLKRCTLSQKAIAVRLQEVFLLQ